MLIQTFCRQLSWKKGKRRNYNTHWLYRLLNFDLLALSYLNASIYLLSICYYVCFQIFIKKNYIYFSSLLPFYLTLRLVSFVAGVMVDNNLVEFTVCIAVGSQDHGLHLLVIIEHLLHFQNRIEVEVFFGALMCKDLMHD